MCNFSLSFHKIHCQADKFYRTSIYLSIYRFRMRANIAEIIMVWTRVFHSFSFVLSFIGIGWCVVCCWRRLAAAAQRCHHNTINFVWHSHSLNWTIDTKNNGQISSEAYAIQHLIHYRNTTSHASQGEEKNYKLLFFIGLFSFRDWKDEWSVSNAKYTLFCFHENIFDNRY